MILLLFILTVSSFLFYGVVGADKTWLLAPLFVLNYGVVTWVLLKQALRAVGGGGDPAFRPSVFRLPPAGLLWVLFIGYGIYLTPQAVVPFESKLVVLFLGGVVGIYLAWGTTLKSFKNNRIFLGALIFVVMLTALYGLIIHFKSPDQVLWTERYASYTGRLMSTYICPNHFAHLMQMLLPFCIVLLFIPQSGIYLRILAGYSFLVFLPPLFLTESRAGWLGSIAAIGIVVCLMAVRRSKKLFLLVLIFVPLCSTLLLFAGWHYSETFQRRMQPVVSFIEGQAEDGVGSESRDFRPQTWMDTIDMINDAPLIGHGPGNYRYTFPEYRNRFKGHRVVTGHPHNEYLELLADYGLIGFVLFSLAWMYGMVWVLIKSLRAEEIRHAYLGFAFLGAAAGTMVHSFFDFQLHVYPNAFIFALLAVLAVGPLVAKRRRQTTDDRGRRASDRIQQTEKDDTEVVPPKRQTPNRKRQTAVNWLLASGYLLLTLFSLQVMSSAFLRALGDKAVEQSANVEHLAVDYPLKAKKYYMLAIKIDPQNWRAYKGMANMLYNQRYFSLDRIEKIEWAEEERKWFEKAYIQNPNDPEIVSALGKCLIFLGRQLESAGDPEQPSSSNVQCSTTNLQTTGLDLLRKACTYRKFNDHYWWMLGVELRKAGHYTEALEIFHAMEKIKRTPSSRKNIQWLEAKLQRGDQRSGNEEAGSGSTLSTSNLILRQEEIALSELFELMDL